MATDKMIPTRILIISDTHGELPYPMDHDDASKYPFHEPLPAADVLIHCGDLTMDGDKEEHKAALKLLTAIKADVKIVIPGNHDITLDREYCAQYSPDDPESLDEIQDVYTGPAALGAGIHYLDEGVEEFTLKNGAKLKIYASAYQPEFCNWAFGYPRTQDRYNSPDPNSRDEIHAEPGPENPVPDHGDTDVMVTHGPPHGILDLNWNAFLDRPGEHCGCEHLRVAVERCKPRLHCFGHIHEAWGAVRKRWDIGGPSEDKLESPRISAEAEQDESATETKAAAPTPSSTSPYHPRTNPNPYYMNTTPSRPGDPPITINEPAAGDRLIMPGPYVETQVPEMCARIDARGLKYGKETLFVNASIMNLSYRPTNAPWVVDLMLPTARGETAEAKGVLDRKEK